MNLKQILMILLIILPQTNAWDWTNHKLIVDQMYYFSPLSLQTKLDLGQLEIGSIAPDKDFHDQRTHHYPDSYNKTLYWLNKTKNYIKLNDYKNASYAFGVATHYISDSFVAPHYISGEDPKLHSRFEHQANPSNTKCIKKEYDTKQTLEQASEENPKDWYAWLETKDPKIPQKEIEQSMNLLFPLFLETFNTSCENRTTKIIYQSPRLGEKTKAYLIILFLIFLANIKIKYP